MWTIILIIAGIQSGTLHIVLPILALVWFTIIGCWPKKDEKPKPKNPIDKHGDEVYGTIDWLRDGKL